MKKTLLTLIIPYMLLADNSLSTLFVINKDVPNCPEMEEISQDIVEKKDIDKLNISYCKEVDTQNIVVIIKSE